MPRDSFWGGMSYTHACTQVHEIRELFDTLDADGEGSIDVNELGELFASLGKPMPEEKLKKLIAEVE
jgi:Ca2+-binding EF-hand superfamily protein